MPIKLDMGRKRSFGEKVGRELMGLGPKLALIVFVFWFCITVLPDIITQMLLDQLNSLPRP